jgi:hypothetical protein
LLLSFETCDPPFALLLILVHAHVSCTSFNQIASFCVSFLLSAYWLLLWIRFKCRPQFLPAGAPSPDGSRALPENIWRLFGTFTALWCAGEHAEGRESFSALIRLKFVLTLDVAGSLSGIVAWSFNMRS